MVEKIIDRNGHEYERPCIDVVSLRRSQQQWFVVFTALMVLLLVLVGWAIASADGVGEELSSVKSRSAVHEDRWLRMEQDIREIKVDVKRLTTQ